MISKIQNSNMVNGQIKPINGISQRIVSIFHSLDRSSFMPKELIDNSFTEKNITLANNRVILRPSIIAKIVMHIDLKENENVLILGSTNGYLAAILSLLAETVIVIEEDDNLMRISEENIKKNEINNVIFFKKNISEGCAEQSPFNAIIIEGAVESLPQTILDQLEIGGRLLTILSENGICNAKIFTRKKTILQSQSLFPCSVPVLSSFKQKNIFSF